MSHCDEDFLNFCQLMIDVNQFREVGFFTGSSEEVAGNHISLNKFGSKDSMDKNAMYHKRYSYVFSSTDDVPSVYRGKIIRYMTDGIHPGYVRLLWESDGREITILYDAVEEQIRHGPSIPRSTRLAKSKLTEKQARSYFTKSNYVSVYHRPYWPYEAVEWITRQRQRGSLSNDVIKRVVRYGCDFVCVSHKGYIEPDKHHEWRFSFSLAELILIKDWSRQQRAMYRTIRVLHKRSVNTGLVSRLRTYHYKTLMLWAVETELPCFWDDEMLFDSARAVLKNMIHCLKIKCLYHYFIPTNNLFDHLLSDDLSDDINAIQCICEDVDLIIEVLTFCVDEEIFTCCLKSFCILPQFLYNSINISSYLISPRNHIVDPFILSMRDKTKLLNSFSDELVTAYELLSGSLLEQKNRKTEKEKNRRNEETKKKKRRKEDSKKKLEQNAFPHPVTEGYNWCLNGLHYHVDEECVRNGRVNIILNTNKDFSRIFLHFYPINTDTYYKSWLLYCELAAVVEGTAKIPISTRQIKHLLYCRRERWIFPNDSVMPFNSTGNVEHHETDKHGETDEKYLKDLTLKSFLVCPIKNVIQNIARYHEFNCCRSPTVPICWFINKAYTASNYYTLLSDYKTSVEICDEAINAYNTSLGNNLFAEIGIPFLLSTQWIEMHDRELQQVLGLAALCRFVIHGSDIRSVHLLCCPVQFALYLKMRCMLDSEGVRSVKTKTARKEYVQHHSLGCRDKVSFFYGRLALFTASKMHWGAALRSYVLSMRMSMNK